MVRHKSRWLIVNITPYKYHCDHFHQERDFDEDENDNEERGREQQQQLPTPFPPSSSLSKPQSQPPSFEKRHIYHALRTSIETAFGIAGSAITDDIHVKYIHTGAQIAIIKVPRDDYKKIRAALTLITTIHIHSTSNTTTNISSKNSNHNHRHPHRQRQELIPIPVVASVLSVKGSARTCKIAALQMLRKWFQANHVNDVTRNKSSKNHKEKKKNSNGGGVGVTDAALMKLHHEMQEIYTLD
mmetsp:Transcript_25392/g.37969  ORF Transcript_25392/g.37969 Transcript_25392/m.37969 type:complete len:242 (-) Transcript_25392:119-844(-)